MNFFKSLGYRLLEHCPNCGSAKVTWAGQGDGSNFFKYFRIIPLQCSKCSTRFATLRSKGGTFIRPLFFLAKICPRCRQEKLYLSTRQGIWENIAPYLGIKPYRCSNCYLRFYFVQGKVMGKISKIIVVLLIVNIAAYAAITLKKERRQADSAAGPPLASTPAGTVSGAPEEEMTISDMNLEKLLQNSNKANIHAGNDPEAANGGFAAALQKEAAPALPKPEKIIVSPDDFRHTEKDVKNFIEGWKVSWQNSAGGAEADMVAYLAHYADNFVADGIARNIWQQRKLSSNKKKKWIHLKFHDLTIKKLEDAADKRVKVNFLQEYNSSNYSDKTKKELILTEVDRDKWLITKETTVE